MKDHLCIFEESTNPISKLKRKYLQYKKTYLPEGDQLIVETSKVLKEYSSKNISVYISAPRM